MSNLSALTPHLVRELAYKLKLGKTCSRTDMVVAEMLLAAPEAIFEVIADLFKLRLLHDQETDTDMVWDWHEVVLLAKVVDPRVIKQWRPISVLSVLYKLYSSTLSTLCNLRNYDLGEHQFAFRSQ